MNTKVLKNHKCKNTRCITQVEKYVPQSFTLIDKKNHIYNCDYCNAENTFKAQ